MIRRNSEFQDSRHVPQVTLRKIGRTIIAEALPKRCIQEHLILPIRWPAQNADGICEWKTAEYSLYRPYKDSVRFPAGLLASIWHSLEADGHEIVLTCEPPLIRQYVNEAMETDASLPLAAQKLISSIDGQDFGQARLRGQSEVADHLAYFVDYLPRGRIAVLAKNLEAARFFDGCLRQRCSRRINTFHDWAESEYRVLVGVGDLFFDLQADDWDAVVFTDASVANCLEIFKQSLLRNDTLMFGFFHDVHLDWFSSKIWEAVCGPVIHSTVKTSSDAGVVHVRKLEMPSSPGEGSSDV